MKSVTLSDSLTSIGRCAFYYCTNLIEINIPDSVTSIGNSAFAVCTSLTNVKLSDSIDNIDYGTFERCSSLTSIVIPNSVTAINSSAFAECTSLTEINIPDSVTSINDSAFSGCSAELTIYCLPGSYAHEFAETNNIHYEFTYIGSSTAKLIVNVDDKYNGFYLTLTSGKTNKIFCNRIIDKERISVYGLNPAEKYKAQIVSDTGSVFGTVENIKFTDDLAQISFSDTKPICSINAVVKDGNNSDVTDLCSIKWYSANGTFIKAGTTLNNVAEGDEFKFRITFNSNILSESYVKPEEQTITVYDENNEVENNDIENNEGEDNEDENNEAAKQCLQKSF